MANPSAAHEPSMEEILASIRQIISEDGESAARGGEAEARQPEPPQTPEPRRPAPEAEASQPEPRRVEAARPAPQPSSPVAASTPAAPSAQTAPSAPVAVSPPVAQRSEPMPLPAGRSAPVDRSLLSRDSDNAVSGAFSALAHTILAQNARTLEDLVAEMLQPMLKEWLDDNLPPLVERLVREEIERVSRGRR
jgi:cell pole-organizing protein PopZ